MNESIVHTDGLARQTRNGFVITRCTHSSSLRLDAPRCAPLDADRTTWTLFSVPLLEFLQEQVSAAAVYPMSLAAQRSLGLASRPQKTHLSNLTSCLEHRCWPTPTPWQSRTCSTCRALVRVEAAVSCAPTPSRVRKRPARTFFGYGRLRLGRSCVRRAHPALPAGPVSYKLIYILSLDTVTLLLDTTKPNTSRL